jgi:hypothetical protein
LALVARREHREATEGTVRLLSGAVLDLTSFYTNLPD